MTVYIDEDMNGEHQWHELHDCTCPVCLGPAEHRIASNGYDILRFCWHSPQQYQAAALHAFDVS